MVDHTTWPLRRPVVGRRRLPHIQRGPITLPRRQVSEVSTITLDELKQLESGDFGGPVGEIGERFYGTTYLEVKGSDWHDRSGKRRPSGGKRHSEHYVALLALTLLIEGEWPFPALSGTHTELWNGHHRSQAALLIGWDKPIPYQYY